MLLDRVMKGSIYFAEREFMIQYVRWFETNSAKWTIKKRYKKINRPNGVSIYFRKIWSIKKLIFPFFVLLLISFNQ